MTTDNYFHCVSLSGGKDSTALMLLMIERGMPIDMVLYADTTMEFPEMYGHLAKLDAHLYRERGLHISSSQAPYPSLSPLAKAHSFRCSSSPHKAFGFAGTPNMRHPQGFEYLMFDQPKQRPASIENRQRLGMPLCGNGWPGMRVRWCTGQLKTHLITKEVNRLKGERKVLNYIGIAADEAQRCKGDQYPLVEWGMTEADALKACYDRGFDFGGLYEIYRRCSCWCCPFQRIGELKKLRQHHPELWARLLDMDNRARALFGAGPLGQFKKDWSVDRLEARFALEDQNQEKDTRRTSI